MVASLPHCHGGARRYKRGFLAKADALQAKGLGLFSGDVNEVLAAGVAYIERLRSEQAKGQPGSCPPSGKEPPIR